MLSSTWLSQMGEFPVVIDTFERWLLRNFNGEGRAVAARLAAQASQSLLGVLTLAGTVAFVGVTFRGLVAAPVLALWLGAMGLVIAAPLLLTLTFAIHGPSTERALRPYLAFSQMTIFALSALAAVSAWVLLPHAPLSLQLVMIVFLLAFVAMILGTDAGPALVILQLGVMASACLFVLVYRLPYALPLALVLGAVSVSLALLRRMIHRSTQAAVMARAETERANAALSAALAEVALQRDAKTRFIAAASHDLRQPVQAAALYVDHALAQSEPDLQARAILGAKRAFTSVDAILETMLGHLQLEAGEAKPRLEPVALNSLFAEVLEPLSAKAGQSGLSLKATPCSGLVMADHAMLRRVLTNLVINAIGHSGGQRVLLGGRRSAGALIIWVIDDGRGVRSVDMAHLFEDYFKGGGEGAAPGGFGIGLSSARRMMEAMKGEISLDERWKRGAAFALRLPLVPPSSLEGEERMWKAA